MLQRAAKANSPMDVPIISAKFHDTPLLCVQDPAIIIHTIGLDAGGLVAKLVGTGCDAPAISSATYVGASGAAGTFDGGMDANIGLEDGIVVSSGNIADLESIYLLGGISTSWGRPGDGDLSALISDFTYDAAVLEFDFSSDSSTDTEISVEYVFASEEFNEYVGFIDVVFGFFVDGTNLALLPGNPGFS